MGKFDSRVIAGTLSPGIDLRSRSIRRSRYFAATQEAKVSDAVERRQRPTAQAIGFSGRSRWVPNAAGTDISSARSSTAAIGKIHSAS